MRPLKAIWFGLLALQLSAPVAWASGENAATRPFRATRNPAMGRIVRRPFNPLKKEALPPHWNIAGQTYVSQQEYADLKGGVTELLKRYPPDKYFFVGLGRDPAPVIAFLQNLGEKNLAVNLPGTSNIGWNGHVGPEDVKRHIEAAVPEEIFKSGRQIVILDVTSSGKTPALFGPYFDQYLQNRGITTPTVKLAFSWQDVKRGGYGPQLTDWINTAPWQDFTRYFSGKYEGTWTPQTGGQGIAEHQRHSMAPNVQPPTQTSPNYAAFRQAIMARMEQDAELDRFLAEHMGLASEAEDNPRAFKQRFAKERGEEAKSVLQLRAFPTRMKESAAELVKNLPERSDPHSKGPYLSDNGEKMNGWLLESLKLRGEAEKVRPGIRKDGPNLVTRFFIEHTLEEALKHDKIRNRDYRRLLGHALGASVMDAEMIETLAAHYKKSPDMQRELQEESEFYLEGSKHQPPGTENMGKNYRLLMAKISPERTFP